MESGGRFLANYLMLISLLGAVVSFTAILVQLAYGQFESLPLTFAFHLLSVIGCVTALSYLRPRA